MLFFFKTSSYLKFADLLSINELIKKDPIVNAQLQAEFIENGRGGHYHVKRGFKYSINCLSFLLSMGK